MQCPQCQFQNHHTATCCTACGTALPGHAQAANPTPSARQRTEAESLFHALLPEIIALLQRDRRVTYRRLAYVFAVDEAFLHEMREELSFRQIARDEDGKGLVWTGEVTSTRVATTAEPIAVPSAAVPTLQPRATEVDIHSHEPIARREALSTDSLQDTPIAILEPSRSAPEAERRQLTVMFCDLADSTVLSQQLDPEDLRQVIRAYQATAAEVIQQFTGYIAQYLGDGLLVYFGWPQAHEDDAPRAVHTGLGIIEALGRLNTRLEAEHGVRLAVRLGLHTGPVVVGEMGGGGRYEHLALGDTPNIAARLQALAAPDTVVISTATAHLVQGVLCSKHWASIASRE